MRCYGGKECYILLCHHIATLWGEGWGGGDVHYYPVDDTLSVYLSFRNVSQ